MTDDERDEYRSTFRAMVKTLVLDRAKVSFPERAEEDALAYFAADLTIQETVRVVVSEYEAVCNSSTQFLSLIKTRTEAALVVLRGETLAQAVRRRIAERQNESAQDG